VVFSCERCGRRYSVPDEKIQGRSFRVTCRGCGNVIVVRSTTGRATAPAQRPHEPVAASARPPPLPATDGARHDAPPPGSGRADAAAPPQPASDVASLPEPTRQVGKDDSEPAALPEAGPPDPPPSIAAEQARPDPDRAAPLAAAEPFGLESTASEAAEHRPPRRPWTPIAAAALVVAIVAAFWTLSRRWEDPPAAPVASPPRVAAPAPPPEVPADRPPEPVAEAVAPPEDVAPQEAGSEAAAALPTPREPAAPSRRAAGTRAPGRDRRAELRIPREERKLLDLLDRKANSAGPSVPVEKLSLDTGRASLDPAAVKRILAESNGAFSACATRALKGGAPLRADRRATLLLTVQSSGAVASASIAEAEVEGSPLGHCLRAAALRLAFPSFAGDTLDVSVPLALSSVR
jgi:hypothetical protein